MGGKLKTNKSVHKRFRITKKGKIKKSRAGKRHLLQHKSSKHKRRLRKSDLVASASIRGNIRRLLPYG